MKCRLPGCFGPAFEGTLDLNGYKIPCAVLEDGQRVLSQRGINTAFGRSAPSTSAEEALPAILTPKNISSFISNELMLKASDRKYYITKGNFKALAVPAELLPEICDVWLKARDAGALSPNQTKTAISADILMRGLAHIGIIALVDEATGYQEIRDKKALAAILDKYLRKELAAWAKKFPDEFYKEMFRLRDWTWNPSSVSRPSVVGKYTNDLVYERLAPNILEELEKKNPKNENGYRANRHHQWLTDEIGNPALAQHLYALIALMRASTSWDGFYRSVQRALPKKNEQLPLLTEN